MKEFSVIIEKDEDGFFVASVPALRGCHTQAKSLDTLMKRIKEAIELCLEVETHMQKPNRKLLPVDRVCHAYIKNFLVFVYKKMW